MNWRNGIHCKKNSSGRKKVIQLHINTFNFTFVYKAVLDLDASSVYSNQFEKYHVKVRDAKIIDVMMNLGWKITITTPPSVYLHIH